MELVFPSYDFIPTELDGSEIIKRIEKIGRVCYKSEDKITDDSAETFVKKIIRSGHHSVIEHINITVKFIIDRGISHELVRHRIGSYSQECVAWDTKITKNYTIKELYDRQFGSQYDKTHNKTINLRSVNDDGVLIPNKFIEIFYKGKQPVYKVKTKRGYEIRCTMNHKFKDINGKYKELSCFNVLDGIMVNGRPSLLKINDEELTNLYLHEKLSPTEIGKIYGVSRRVTADRLHKLGIFKKHLNDKNKDKYNKNHTRVSYEKMRESVLKQYENGRTPWNKDLTEDMHPSVKRQGDSLRKNHHDNGFGENNSNYAGGPTKHVKAQLVKNNIKHCELCMCKNERLEVHHIDKNIENNLAGNLIKVCTHCHNLLHHGWHVAKKETLDIIESIEFDSIDDTYDLEMAAPYHNYIANGFITHNSTRYCAYDKHVKFIIPCWLDLEPGIYNSKEIIEIKEDAARHWAYSIHEIETYYHMLLQQKNWKPGWARSVLPNALKTEIVATFNLREWRHVLDLRCSKAAHEQIREVMIPVLNIMNINIPIVFEDLAEKYRDEIEKLM